MTYNVLGFAGSLRAGSFNRKLLAASVPLAPPVLEITLFDDLASIPLLNEDEEAASGGGPRSVQRLRARVRDADAVLIATPEYNQGLPAVTKNLVDWLSRKSPDALLSGKPVALMGATTGRWGTRHAQQQLRHSLTACEALVMPAPQLYAASAQTLFDPAGALTDAATGKALRELLAGFAEWIARMRPVSGERAIHDRLIESGPQGSPTVPSNLLTPDLVLARAMPQHPKKSADVLGK